MTAPDDLVLVDADSEEDVALADLWAERAVALIFLRHYGWTHCREHALQLQRESDDWAASGGDLVAVGMGTPAHARVFREETGFEGRLLLSRDKAAYEAFDIKRASTAGVFSPQSTVAGLKRSVGLRRQGLAPVKRPQQDWHQLGAAFVIAPGGEIVWEHRSRHPGDLPDDDAMLAELRSAA